MSQEKPKPPASSFIFGESTPAPATVFRESGEMLNDFFTEVAQHLEDADALLLGLEKAPDDKKMLDALYRAFHTIKGLSGFFGLKAMNKLAHQAESMLELTRENTLQLNGIVVDFIFAALDGLKLQLQFAREADASKRPLRVDPGLPQLIASMKRFLENPNDPTIAVPGMSTMRQSPMGFVPPGGFFKNIPPSAPSAIKPLAELSPGGATQAANKGIPPDTTLAPSGAIGTPLSTISRSPLAAPPAAAKPAAPAPAPVEVPAATVNPAPVAASPAPATPAANATANPPPAAPPAGAVVPAAGAAPTGKSPGDKTDKDSIRVDCERLDKLINIIGELVISSSMIGQLFTQRDPSSAEAQSFTQLNKVVRDLQEMSLGLRLVPVSQTFQRMARIARDVAKKLSKQVEFLTEGEDTELDKSVVDHIGDPLMHMVRNAIDHGIERPADRVAAGKPPIGTVLLRAFHQGGNVYLELTDDGKGLDREAIVKKAIERGLITPDTHLSDAEICSLIFEPGFSTAQQVTDVSGRGVGMDVVRKNVEALQGSVTIRSEKGKGSTMAIRLPLTLAILEGLMVLVGDSVYVVPLLSVLESLRPRPQEFKKVGARSEVILVRGETVPLLRLHRLFNIKPRVMDPCESLVVIVEDQTRKCALLVDELVGQAQVVIKNLEANYHKVEGVAGATILGDGSIALILDVFGLIRLAGGLADENHTFSDSSSRSLSS